ncbi:MAG: DegT/DnrJ/EryC1/StrS family aminotransferase [Gloeocapsa sp. UFS-A4-WI-NPMV-4B04]|jgi:dTDP-4-amino-4,6-dideoxygalactose transaminase|nr:DegT/DnrJ/EryC1/StrS family aminotransferase [Gloeocapsa sp. UFS-A4-WI-NPMV-4B04]
MVQSVNIPILDLAQQYANIEAEVSDAVLKVLASGGYIGGSRVLGFEQQFGAYIGVSECVVCNSGTDALYLALRALEIGSGDEVITTPFTFFATTEVISAVGATPVFVDIDPQTFNLDIDQLATAITNKTRAIIPVHLFGQPLNMTALMALASAHQLAVIEDCAQATGALWAGQKVGSIGHIGCFSFYPTKNLGACGDGGAVTTNDPAIAAKIRMLREHGSENRYLHTQIGINSRLDALQASILQIKLRYLDTWNQQRQAIAHRYHQLLNHIPGIVIPQELSGGQGVWNQYTIRLQAGERLGALSNNYRDKVRQLLQQQGVGSMVYYPLPLHLQPVYQNLGYQLGQLPVAEQACHEVLSLPMFPELSQEPQEQVIYSLKDCLSN